MYRSLKHAFFVLIHGHIANLCYAQRTNKLLPDLLRAVYDMATAPLRNEGSSCELLSLCLPRSIAVMIK